MEERPQTGRRGFYGNFFYFVSVLWLTDNAKAAARKVIERVAYHISTGPNGNGRQRQ